MVTPPPGIPTASLAHSAFHGLKWRYGGALIQSGLQFGVGIALARLLTPEAFGVVGMAMMAIGFGRLIGDLGFGAAIIQRPNLTHRHVQAAFTGSMLVGALLFGGLWFLAPIISEVFAQDALTSMLRFAGLSLIVSGMSVIFVGVLRRDLQFRLLSIIETISYTVGFGVVGLSMAWLGYGAWSLVAANIIQPLCLVILAAHFGTYQLRPCFSLREYRDLSQIASAELLNNVINYIAENLHFFVIGKWLGAAALGLFNRSFYLMHMPMKHFSFALGSVMFPLYAKIQGDIPRLGKVFLQTVSITALFTMPLFLAIAAAPEIIVGGLFGDKWKEASGTLRILCLSGPFMATMRVFGAVSHARGYIFNECGRQIIYLVFVGIALGILFPWGLEGLALAVTLGVIVRYVLLAHLSIKLAAVSWQQFFMVQIPGCLVGFSVAIPVYIAAIVSDMLLISDFLRLTIVIVVAVVSLILTLLFFPPTWFGDLFQWVVDRFGPKLPGPLRQLVNGKLTATRHRVVIDKMKASI